MTQRREFILGSGANYATGLGAVLVGLMEDPDEEFEILDTPILGTKRESSFARIIAI